MRKRKRGCGEYTDETGETSIVQTTKQAKRDHQKNGKWYKVPTEREIRCWDREDAQRNAAEKAQQREQNKKINATKRAEAAAKDQQKKTELYEAGKITFTQTLAKKDEDQLNLHSWFGRKPMLKKSGLEKGCANKDVNKANGRIVKHSVASNIDNTEVCAATTQCKQKTSPKRTIETPAGAVVSVPADSSQPDRRLSEVNMDQMLDMAFDLPASQDFDIAEDDTAGAAESDTKTLQDTDFKIPTLPVNSTRPPLSPMSVNEINRRSSQSSSVSHFSDKLAKAGIQTSPAPAGTQMVRDLLAGICTQDLAVDLDFEDDHPIHDKENTEPPSSPAKTSPYKPNKSSPLKQSTTVEAAMKVSFSDSISSFDYDDLFAELEDPQPQIEDFHDNEADDDTLLLMAATQHAKTNISESGTVPTQIVNASSTSSRSPFKRVDSFAVDGLDDEDLLEGLAQYERSRAT